MKRTSFVLSDRDIGTLDHYAEFLAESFGLRVTRSDALRALIRTAEETPPAKMMRGAGAAEK